MTAERSLKKTWYKFDVHWEKDNMPLSSINAWTNKQMTSSIALLAKWKAVALLEISLLCQKLFTGCEWKAID